MHFHIYLEEILIEIYQENLPAYIPQSQNMTSLVINSPNLF